MPRTEHNKLVRDKIPDIIAKNGGVASVKALGENDFRVALYQKLLEELHELVVAVKLDNAEVSTQTLGNILEELADVMEVMHAIVRIHGLSMDVIDAKRVAKRHERGGFEKRVYLEYVDEE